MKKLRKRHSGEGYIDVCVLVVCAITKTKVRYIRQVDTCVCCGCPVPEGRMVCYNCEKDTASLLEKNHKKAKSRNRVRGIFSPLRNN